MEKINILYTVWGLSYGGAERFVLNLVKKLDRTKYNIIIFSDRNEEGPLEKDFVKCGAKVIYSKYHRFKHPIKYVKQLKTVIKEEKINIIHANDDFNMIFPLMAKSHSVKFIAHSHSTSFRFTKSKILTKLARIIVPKMISNKADVLLGCSNDAGEALFDKNSYYVISNGIELEDYEFNSDIRKELREKYGIGKDEKVFLNIGRMDVAKNQTFLIDVFGEYYKIDNKSKLIVIGDGDKKSEIIQKIKNLHLENNVILIPPTNDANKFYNIADVYIMTSLYEGMPMTSIEAQTNGLKCIFSDTISKEADHAGDTLYIPLEKRSKYWATVIANTGFNRHVLDPALIARYDMDEIAKTVQSVYNALLYASGDKPKVSVVIPAYNAEKYISKSITSVLNQDYENIEIIIVNDGSSDNTKDIVSAFAKKNKRIIFINSENNGANISRKMGIDAASGEYIMFLDSDDMYEKNAVSTIVKYFEMYPLISSIKFRAKRMRDGSTVEDIPCKRYPMILDKKIKLKLLLQSDVFGNLWSQAFKLSDIKNIDSFKEGISYCEDYLDNYYIHKSIDKTLLVEEVLYQYRKNDTSTTGSSDLSRIERNIEERLYVSRRIFEDVEDSAEAFVDENDLSIALGFQAERLRREFARMLSNEAVCNKKDFSKKVSKIIKSQDFKKLFKNIKKSDIKRYIRTLKLSEKIKYNNQIKAIYGRDVDKIWKHLNIYNRIRMGIKKCFKF